VATPSPDVVAGGLREAVTAVDIVTASVSLAASPSVALSDTATAVTMETITILTTATTTGINLMRSQVARVTIPVTALNDTNPMIQLPGHISAMMG